MSERRAPVQGDLRYERRSRLTGKRGELDGTISWEEHMEAWLNYRHGGGQTAETIASRGGFSYSELVNQLGHAPVTWKPKEGA